MYYDGKKLLNTKDLDGETPEIFMVCGNRVGGKTVYWSKKLVDDFQKDGSQFVLCYRFQKDLRHVESAFFDDIKTIDFEDGSSLAHLNMSSENIGDGDIKKLYLINGKQQKECGYAIALNNADNLRRYRALFKKCGAMFFDEFQSETNHYCPDEIIKFMSVHTTISGGRYLPVYMCSNAVSMINPYYTAFRFSARLQKDTKFLRGHGVVLEQAYIDSAAQKLKQSGFMRAFGDNKYIDYSTENVYLDDNSTFIQKMTGDNDYILTLISEGKEFSIKKYGDILYVDDKADKTFPQRIAVKATDHGVDSILLPEATIPYLMCKKYFNFGQVRFKNILCKQAFFDMIAIR